ncbi:MAG: NADPH-dependent glutamate synthase [Clostridia bacterium]|nr:NADPH-dependent glutamate synthase [Clostridia bacterium]
MAMEPKKTPMPTQDPRERITNFREVALGYTPEDARREALRCLNCKNRPCVEGCPVNVNIPGFIQKIREGDLDGAYEVIAATSSLPAVCGRVCPQENQCEAKCAMGIKFEPVGIGRLERYVADHHNAASVPPRKASSNGCKVAVVGSGPSSLTCAGDLAKLGYDVTVFEALHAAGGVLVYGIPEFRLPKSIVAREVENLKALGVTVETNVVVGKTVTVDELFEEGFRAVFLGTGAGLPMFMNIPGENLVGVYSANEYLTRSNLMKAYREDSDTPIRKGGRVAVVGGGNVAMDAARTALRLGAEKVTIIYRRSEAELPARREEAEHAREEGVEFLYLANPVEILGYRNFEDPRDPKNGAVTGIRCTRMELGEPDERGRRVPRPIAGSEFHVPVDTVVIAIGTSPNPLIRSIVGGVQLNRRGGIVVTEEGATHRAGVYAGGDAVTGAATVISAMGAGKTAAAAIHRYLSE